MQSMKTRGLDEFIRDLDGLLKKAPQMRRVLHEQAEGMLRSSLDASINARVNDKRGHVKSWQEARTGSGGGYAAIAAKAETFRTKGRRRDAVGALTNYIESGHGNAGGRKFYEATGKQAEREFSALCVKFEHQLRKELEG